MTGVQTCALPILSNDCKRLIDDTIKHKQIISNKISIMEKTVMDEKGDQAIVIKEMKEKLLMSTKKSTLNINQFAEMGAEIDIINHKLRGNIIVLFRVGKKDRRTKRKRCTKIF